MIWAEVLTLQIMCLAMVWRAGVSGTRCVPASGRGAIRPRTAPAGVRAPARRSTLFSVPGAGAASHWLPPGPDTSTRGSPVSTKSPSRRRQRTTVASAAPGGINT